MTSTLDLDTLTLDRGSHATREAGVCVMEAVAWAADLPHSDLPPCTSRVLRDYLLALNDTLDDDRRQALKPYVWRVINTADQSDADTRAAWRAADWLVRTYTPAWLRLAGLDAGADALANADPIIDTASLSAIRPALNTARTQAAAAWAVARAAAWDATRAGDAAWAVARAAAWDAAWAAARAGDAAWAAARDAAWDAARDAARAAFWPTTVELHASAFDLLDRMIACYRPMKGTLHD